MERLKNSLPLLSLFLLVVGTGYLVQFYREFNINILSFLDFTEVLLLQFNFFTLSFGVLATVVPWLIQWFLWRFPRKPPVESLTPEEDERWNQVWQFLKYLTVILMVTLGGMVSTVSAYWSARAIKNGRPDYAVTLKVNDQPLKTDSSYVFVGRTKNFIFFYDQKQERGDVFANEDVKELQFFKPTGKR